MSILKHDKVMLEKSYGELNAIGEVFEVGNLTETMVVLRDIKTKVAVCGIDYDDFDKYFSVVRTRPSTWTPWTALADDAGRTIVYYRTNNKKVQVRNADFNTPINSSKFAHKIYRAEASCSPNDEFSLFYGVQLAYMRMRMKYLKDMYNMFKYNMTESQKYLNKLLRASGDIK